MSDALYHEARFNDPDIAREHLEAIRWPNGPVCPHCGGTERNSLMHGKSHRPGLYFCGDCRDPFTVTVGTVFERSKIGLHKWLLAMQLMCSSKKGMSSHQLHRTLGVTYKTAWFMSHRIREAMRVGGFAPFGSNGGSVEVDETYVGAQLHKANRKSRANAKPKSKVLSLVDRTSGTAYSIVINNIDWNTVKPILIENISHEARVLTDEGTHLPPRQCVFHEARNRESFDRGIRALVGSLNPHKHRRRLLLAVQAWHARCLSALWQATSASLSCRVRFPLQQSRETGHQ